MNAPLKPGILLANRYHILSCIGKGGYGVVYKARAGRWPGKLVAIKEINMSILSVREKIEVTDTFNREIRLLSSLHHKNLPRIHNHFTDAEHWYIVMDYIEGQTLEEMLARYREGRLPIRQAVEIALILCDVLSYLHKQIPTIIFRDVKPGNIMLTPWGHLYLIDFGIARRYRAGQSHDTIPLGSPGYAAPEQYGGRQTTGQTDIYGLGATLQTMLTGKEPLEIRMQGLPPNIPIPQELQALIIKMMEAEPFKRPNDAQQVKQSLQGLKLATLYSYSRSLCSTGWGVGIMTASRGLLDNNPFVILSTLLLSLSLVIGYWIHVIVQSRQVTPLKLSAKAMLFITAKHLANSFILFGVFGLLFPILTLLYLLQAFITSRLPVFWFGGAGLVLVALAIFMLQLQRRYKRRRQTQSQAQQLQQLQRHP